MGNSQSKAPSSAHEKPVDKAPGAGGSGNDETQTQPQTIGEIEGSTEVYGDFKAIADVYYKQTQGEQKGGDLGEPGGYEVPDIEVGIREFNETKSMEAWLNLIGKTINCDDSKYADFAKAMANAQRLKNLFDDLKKAGALNDRKFDELFFQMLNLVRVQNNLFFETLIIMNKVKSQAQRCHLAVETWRQQMMAAKSGCTTKEHVVQKCADILNGWFSNDKELVSLKRRWAAYNTQVQRFSRLWEQNKDEVIAQFKKVPQISAGWAVAAGITGSALTYGMVHLVPVLMGAAFLSSGILIGVAGVAAATWAVWAAVRYHKANKKAQEISQTQKTLAQQVLGINNEIDSLIEDSDKVRRLCENLIVEMKRQMDQKEYILDAADLERFDKIKELLKVIEDSLVQFMSCCDMIITTITRERLVENRK